MGLISGFDTTTHFGCQQRYQSFTHPTLSDVIDTMLDKAGIRRLDITPKEHFENESIMTENGMRINITKQGIQIGPL